MPLVMTGARVRIAQTVTCLRHRGLTGVVVRNNNTGNTRRRRSRPLMGYTVRLDEPQNVTRRQDFGAPDIDWTEREIYLCPGQVEVLEP